MDDASTGVRVEWVDQANCRLVGPGFVATVAILMVDIASGLEPCLQVQIAKAGAGAESEA